ncbi:stress-activated map kinase-interacting protein-like protein [Dendryphion nanum]|uniref:Stress-activated map kinase-interacting protein-like protein n=1 Tax=Dendryphion nanum TaxID=256645 RepID=A0A9P9IBS4_9PLEO|nr:stress-activated map kinase-interacting protein-like protein [Dendryphion nanum]
MSLLQNEDFVLYQLRAAYLNTVKDGVGERLINVDSSVLNNPAFRAAGWVPNAADIRRTYSPPIPTAVTSDYFQAPRSAGLRAPEGFGEDEEEGGMVTGGGGSNDTVGPTLNTKRRRRKELLEEDDSSDLSDESDDDADGTHRPANQIKFQKMPLRTRAGSSPIRGSALRNGLSDAGDGPSVMVTSPSRPPDSRLRRGSLGTIESIKERARRDTITSSEMSSENEMDSLDFQKKKVNPHRAAKASHLLSERNREDEKARLEALDEGNESDSSLSSEFSGTADSASLLGAGGLESASVALPNIPTLAPFANTSPRKPLKQATPTLQALPPPRPISFVLPVSALTQALQAKEQKPSNPLQRFAGLSATSEAQVNPIYIRIYCPWAAKPSKALECLLKKFDDKGEAVTVSEAIGFALWRYQEEKIEPPVPPEKLNVNGWVLRMYDDGEIDDEFPALTRNKPLMAFASNNSRGMRPRARDKPWDEFGLIQASEREFAENEKITPIYSREAAAAVAATQTSTSDDPQPTKPPPKPMATRAKSFRNPITGPSFAPTATRKDTSNLADVPSAPSSQSASRMGAPKTVNVHFTDENFNTRHIPVPCTTDTYIAEIFDRVCRDLHLDKALYVLKVTGTTTVAPSDRTVEALGLRSDLDLLRRRFVGDGVFGLAGSPGSSSPNAPLIISTGGVPKKTKRSDRITNQTSSLNPLVKLNTDPTYYRRYTVTRKQPMSFTSSSSRILALDSEYMHILPDNGAKSSSTSMTSGGADPSKAVFDTSKMTSVLFSSIVGSKQSKKHPRMFRVIVFKERETKRYDFEARGAEEAREIVEEIKRGVGRFQEGIV